MAKKNNSGSPLTFDLPLELIAKIESSRRALGLRSASQVVRAALSRFNFNRYRPVPSERRQISVRITDDDRALLNNHARRKKISVGELLRAALSDLAAKPAGRKRLKG
ncbi:MAG: ribbon-helix-helix protein, CopG family [Verrucomicrobiota bacterium]|nr:ribbon-helix-helix protein, CopG family [Verrucomicrobiota bacterium]